LDFGTKTPRKRCGMKILLCEDDFNIATIARLALEQLGKHQVTWVTDGEQAQVQGASGTFDLILLDDMMPKMSGVNVCAAYLKSGTHKTPVIFMSANPQDKRVDEFKPIAIGYIPKPFDPMELNAKIELLLKSCMKKAA
jgi:DNA-binding response OmpR family regulator